MDRHQPKSLFVEVEEILLVRNVHHVALVAEHPPVEFAREVFFVAALHECARVGKLLTQFVSAVGAGIVERSEEHTSELQSLMRISYAVFCLKKQTKTTQTARHI